MRPSTELTFYGIVGYGQIFCDTSFHASSYQASVLERRSSNDVCRRVAEVHRSLSLDHPIRYTRPDNSAGDLW